MVYFFQTSYNNSHNRYFFYIKIIKRKQNHFLNQNSNSDLFFEYKFFVFFSYKVKISDSKYSINLFFFLFFYSKKKIGLVYLLILATGCYLQLDYF